MPLARDGTLPLNLTFSLVDNNGNRGFVSFNLPNGLTILEAGSLVADLEAGLAGISDARIERATVNVVFTQPASYTYVAPPSSEVERKLALRFQDATSFYDFTPEVPSPRFTLELEGTDNVSLLDPAVVAFANTILLGPLGPGNGPITFAGRDITRLTSAYIMHRNRSRKR